jgi:hypothetical protein
MKLIKIAGLGFLAAIVSMALIGVSPAMAENTALCNTDEEPCAAGDQTTEVHFVAEDILIRTSTMDYECDALLLATVLKLGSPQTLDATSLVYSGCNQGCTRTVTKLGTFTVLRTKAESAVIAGNGFEVHVVCGSLINCTYSFNELTGSVSGSLLTGDNGHVTFAEATLGKVGGFLCPKEAKLNALFVALKAFYVKS